MSLREEGRSWRELGNTIESQKRYRLALEKFQQMISQRGGHISTLPARRYLCDIYLRLNNRARLMPYSKKRRVL